MMEFQFTLPCRERRNGLGGFGGLFGFNSRSRVGSDHRAQMAEAEGMVSIHAPV